VVVVFNLSLDLFHKLHNMVVLFVHLYRRLNHVTHNLALLIVLSHLGHLLQPVQQLVVVVLKLQQELFLKFLLMVVLFVHLYRRLNHVTHNLALLIVLSQLGLLLQLVPYHVVVVLKLQQERLLKFLLMVV
jgi:hypothetical protein